MIAYLDNAATTKPLESVRQVMLETLGDGFGNPSSLHHKGVEGERYVRDARGAIASTLKAEEKDIIFTSGGTESNNMAILGAALAARRRGRHIVTTAIEHPSVDGPLEWLREEGFSVTYLGVDANGHIRMDELLDAIQDDTILVSVMHVNNEVGAVADVAGIASAVKEKKGDVLFHVDAIQSYGKYPIFPRRVGIDLLSASGHKIHGPKGVGFLYVGDRERIRPILFGGGQQQGLRSGTENVPGIAGIGKAAEEAYASLPEAADRMYEEKRHFMEEVGKLPGVRLNCLDGLSLREAAPHIVSVSFEGIRSEVLLQALSERGVYVSAGSACSSRHRNVSKVLKAVGVREDLLESTLRFSFSSMTTREELDAALEAISSLLPKLRRYGGR